MDKNIIDKYIIENKINLLLNDLNYFENYCKCYGDIINEYLKTPREYNIISKTMNEKYDALYYIDSFGFYNYEDPDRSLVIRRSYDHNNTLLTFFTEIICYVNREEFIKRVYKYSLLKKLG